MKKINQKIPAYGIFEYLNHLESLLKEKNAVNTKEQFLDAKFLEKALSIRAAYWVADVLKKLSQKGMKKKTAMNDLYAQDILAMSRNHHLYMSYLIYVQDVDKLQPKDKNIKPHLVLLGKIFALKRLLEDSSTLYETGFFTTGAKQAMGAAMEQLLRILRPQMIPLVELESDEMQDKSYLSAIGNKYGDIYERQLELAMNSRLNKVPKAPFWDEKVKPLLGGRSKL